MKTKVLLSAIFLITLTLNATTCLAKNELSPVYISISDAIKDPAFVQQMYWQLNDNFLHCESTLQKYSMEVFYSNTKYIITGSFEEWELFFLMDITINKGNQLPAIRQE